MRILHVVSGDGWGGLEQVVELLAKGVGAQAGFEVEALLFNEGRLANVLRTLGVIVHVVPESEHSFMDLARATRIWIERRKPDVVHAHRYKEILVAALALGWSRRGFVVTLHGLQPAAQLARSQRALLWGTLITARLAGARFVGVSNELTERVARVVSSRRVTNIPNPMPIIGDGAPAPDLRRRLGWDPSRRLVGFVGRLEHVKGPDVLMKIAARTKSSAGFVVIGGGSLERELHSRAAQAGLTDQVAFLGETPNASRFIDQFDVLALPSRHEGLPLVLLEAAAAAVPVVAFDVGGVREVLDGGGAAVRVIPPMDLDAFAAAVDALMLDRDAVRRDAEMWADLVRSRFSLATIAERYCEVYRIAARQ